MTLTVGIRRCRVNTWQKKMQDGVPAQTGEQAVTLSEAVGLAFQRSTDRILTQQLCSCLHAQLYKRWLRFCEGRPDAELIMDPETSRPGVRIPLPAAREFILANLDWAKGRVMARLTRMMWARNSLLTDDDEYEENAEY